jgi:hypothetical protein
VFDCVCLGVWGGGCLCVSVFGWVFVCECVCLGVCVGVYVCVWGV